MNTRLDILRAGLAAELRAGGRDDLAALLDDLRTDARGDAVRVVVCGETRRGKSTLVNSLDVPALPTRERGLDLDLDLPSLAREGRLRDGFTHTSEVFDNLTRVVAGATTVITVLSGAGVVAACLALAAGIGWWHVRGDDERQRRAQLGEWVDTAVKDASARLDAELRRRLRDGEQYVDGVLPALVGAKRQELRRVRAELTDLRAAGEPARREAVASRKETAGRLSRIAVEADVLAANALSIGK